MRPMQTKRSRVRRRRERGVYDAAAIQSILDEGLVAHVGFVADGQPAVVPLNYVRIGSSIYFHSAYASRLARGAKASAPVCVTVSLIDGLVLARSAFYHSMNYRCVMLFGTPIPVTDTQKKRTVLAALIDRFVPGRSGEVREPSAEELKATSVVELAIDEVSAKIRSGPAGDKPGDLERPCWAGVVPIEIVMKDPVASNGVRCRAPKVLIGRGST
jgi:uncharacterized protein